MHPIHMFRKRNKLRQKDFALKIGIHPNHLSAIERGVRIPSSRLCRLIEHITGGEVTFNDLIPPVNFPDPLPPSVSVPDNTPGG